MSRYHTPSYGMPPNSHPPHAGANSSNVINRQTANANKYEKAPPQTNSNKYEQQPQIPLANVSSQQQQQLQQQKTKLVSTEFTIGVNHPPGSHHAGVISHNNFRMPHTNSNYHGTQPSVNYSQSVPPQPPTAHQTPDRQSVCQIGQQPQPQQASQQSQDHKMQHTNQYPMVPRGQQRMAGAPTNRMSNTVQHSRQQQQNQMGQAPTAVPQFVYMQPIRVNYSNYTNFHENKQNMNVPYANYQGQSYYMPMPHVQQPRPGAGNPQHILSGPGASSAQISSYQQSAHQISSAMHLPGYPVIRQQQPAAAETQPKRPNKRLQIIDPNTNEEVKVDKIHTPNSSGSNPHSSALKIEAPTSSQVPNQQQQQIQKSSNEPTCDTSNESEQSTCDHSNVEVQIEASNIEEPPHTPVVSAIADGPSVDIMPKQPKNVKRTNKSPEWPAPSAEKTNSESSSCDNFSKSASTGNTISSSSNEWVKVAPKVSNESEHKDSQKHNPKSKHSAPNHSTASQPNKGKLAHQQTDLPANMVATVQQQAPTSTKEQLASESKPVVPAAVQQDQPKLDNTGRSNDKTKQPPQQVEKAQPEIGVAKSNKEKVTDTMSNSNVVPTPTPTPTAETESTKTKTATNTSIDETDKLINSLDSMSISSRETNAEKNDKLDTKSVEFNNNSQKPSAAPLEASTRIPEPDKSTENDAPIVESAEPTQASTPNTESQTDLRSSENDSRASEKIDTSSPATTNNGLVETIINNNLTNTTSANTNQLNNNAVNKDSDNNVVNSTTEKTTDETQPATQPQLTKTKLMLNYEEGQWSPDNMDGKKCYNRQQIMLLRESDAARSLPQIEDSFSLIRKSSPSNANNNNSKNQSSSSNNRNQYGKRPSTQGAGNNQQMSQGGGKGSKTGMIHLSLSLREDVKLNESANAWKPTFLGAPVAATAADSNNIDMFCKRVRGILNKLTPEKFEPLLDQLQALKIDSTEKLSGVISLVFEKAIDEPNFSQAYAQLCQKLSKPMEEKEEAERKSGEKSNKDTGQAVFKKELLNKCQTEFNNHVANENAILEKLKPLHTELSQIGEGHRKTEITMQLEEEERKLRRRSVGTVRFIGELYRQNMLLTSIMEWCVVTLLNIRSEEKLECLCKLLTTVGQKMEHQTFDEEYDKKYYRDLTLYFQQMQQIASDKKQSKISSRVRFMLMDVIELRKNKWVPRRTDSNPKKMGQIQKEVMEEQYKKDIQMLASMPNPGMGNNNMRKDNRDRNDRGNMNSRGGSMSGSGYNNSNKMNRGAYQDNDGWIHQGGNKSRGSNNNTFDPAKFRGNSSNIEDITKTSLGTPNQFQWKLNTPQSQATTSLTNSFSVLESNQYKSLSGNRSKEPYSSKGSMERERDGPHSRSGSQHGSRDNSAARNPYSSRSLQQMRPPQMQFNTLPMNSTSSSSSSQRGIRSDNKMNHQSLSSSTTSLSNLPSSSSLTPSSSDPKISEDVNKQVEKVIRSVLENLLTKVQRNLITSYNELEDAPQLDKINQVHRWALVRDLHNQALDITGLTEAKCCFIGTICTYWINHKQITKQDYVKGLSEYITLFKIIAFDVPKIYEWTSQMISEAVFNEIITLNELKNTAEDSRAKILGILLPFMAYAYGPQYVRDLWKKSNCKWEQFVGSGNVDQFIEQNKLKFVENPNETLAPVGTDMSDDRFIQRIYQLVRRDKFSEKEVAEYIKIHVPTINKQSIRLLTKTLIEAALNKTKAGITIDETILSHSIDTLKRYIGGEKMLELQLESLYAIQLLSNKLEHPSGFLHKVFTKLYEAEAVPPNVFKQWETSAEEPLGKGVAVKNLTHFLKCVSEESYESEEEEAK